MPRAKKEEKKEEKSRFYKGYEMKWLKEETTHPDYYLVKEYEDKFGEIK